MAFARLAQKMVYLQSEAFVNKEARPGCGLVRYGVAAQKIQALCCFISLQTLCSLHHNKEPLLETNIE